MAKPQTEKQNVIEEKPPVLKSWRQLYTVVFINLVVLIVLFYIFTVHFR
jgi:hypothetical protein